MLINSNKKFIYQYQSNANSQSQSQSQSPKSFQSLKDTPEPIETNYQYNENTESPTQASYAAALEKAKQAYTNAGEIAKRMKKLIS